MGGNSQLDALALSRGHGKGKDTGPDTVAYIEMDLNQHKQKCLQFLFMLVY